MSLDIDSRYAIARHNAACVLDRLSCSDSVVARLTMLATYQTGMVRVSDLNNDATRRAAPNNIPALQFEIQRLAGPCRHAFEHYTL